jgi:hypothetical protein
MTRRQAYTDAPPGCPLPAEPLDLDAHHAGTWDGTPPPDASLDVSRHDDGDTGPPF